MTGLFLVCAAFMPRLTLVWCYAIHAIPANDTPFALDFLAAIFVPRFLIAWWLYVADAHPGFVGLFILLGLSELLASSSSAKEKEE